MTLRRSVFYGKNDGPHLLITGAVHGDEFEPIAAIHRLISLFATIQSFETKQPVVGELAGTVTFIPIVNESAFLRGHRTADDGLDLARTFPGKPDGSVTEKTAHELSQIIREADYYIDLHTGGTELSVSPLAGYMLHPNSDVLEKQRMMARAFNLPIIWGTSANLDGRSLSVARDANVPAIYCEYLGAATCTREGIDAYVEGCLNVMASLQMIDRPLPVSRVRHVVENPTPGSGHMQVCNPSPATGYFDTNVQLGDRVNIGDKLGCVYPLDGGKPVEIFSIQSGVMIVLRTFPRVRAGESIGVILDLPAE